MTSPHDRPTPLAPRPPDQFAVVVTGHRYGTELHFLVEATAAEMKELETTYDNLPLFRLDWRPAKALSVAEFREETRDLFPEPADAYGPITITPVGEGLYVAIDSQGETVYGGTPTEVATELRSVLRGERPSAEFLEQALRDSADPES